jgi:hypothetical protein
MRFGDFAEPLRGVMRPSGNRGSAVRLARSSHTSDVRIVECLCVAKWTKMATMPAYTIVLPPITVVGFVRDDANNRAYRSIRIFYPSER